MNDLMTVQHAEPNSYVLFSLDGMPIPEVIVLEPGGRLEVVNDGVRTTLRRV